MLLSAMLCLAGGTPVTVRGPSDTDNVCAGSRAALAHAVAVEAAYAEADAALCASAVAASADDVEPPARHADAAQSTSRQAPPAVKPAASEDSCFSAGSSAADAAERTPAVEVASRGKQRTRGDPQPQTPPTPSRKEAALAAQGRRIE